jgi:hypothetical protein
LILGAAAVAAYFLLNKSSAAAVIPPTGTVPGLLNPSDASPTNVQLATIATFTPPAGNLSASPTVVNVGIDPVQQGIVAAWANGTGSQGAINLANSQIPSEIAGMYDIITNDWSKTGIATPAQTAFWNSVVAKYGI